MTTTTLTNSLVALILSWSTGVHNAEIYHAFKDRFDADCIAAMSEGSLDVDSDQSSGSAYMHAMRSEDQSESESGLKMAQFIDGEYVKVRQNFREAYRRGLESTEGRRAMREACFHRGRALHPVMDSTSPAHIGVQPWNMLGRPLEAMRHGDFLRTKLGALVLSVTPLEDGMFVDDKPELIEYTALLMRATDLAYLSDIYDEHTDIDVEPELKATLARLKKIAELVKRNNPKYYKNL